MVWDQKGKGDIIRGSTAPVPAAAR